jgi:hypothetical protein
MQDNTLADLHSRIEGLEYDLDVLKNQLLKTFRSIEDQVRVSYSKDPRRTAPPIDDGAEEAGVEAPAGAARPEEGQRQTSDELPVAKKVSLDRLRAVRQKTGPSLEAGPLNKESLVALSDWVMDSVPELGEAQVVEILNLLAERGLLPSEAEAFLLRVAAASGDSTESEAVSGEALTEAVTRLNRLLGSDAAAVDAELLPKERLVG